MLVETVEEGSGGVGLGLVIVVKEPAGERKWWQVVGLKMSERRNKGKRRWALIFFEFLFFSIGVGERLETNFF